MKQSFFLGDRRDDSLGENCQKKKHQRMIDVSKVIREKVYASIVAVTTSESSKKNTTFGPFSSEINVMIVSEKKSILLLFFL